MLLAELVAHRELRLRVLCEGDGLDRPVRWTYTTDLPDPSRYLGGGELVLSGLVWRRGPADSERFVGAVARSGAVALAAGEAVFGEIPADVVDACLRHGLTLLAVPVDVSFGTLTETVVGALSAARGDRLANTLGRQRRLLAAFADGATLTDLAATVSAGTGLTCRVLTAGGLLVAGPAPGDAERDAVVTAFLTAGRLPVTAGGHLVVPASPGSARATGRLVAARLPDGCEPDTGTVDAIGELATIAALDRSREREGTAVTRPIADDALARVAAGAGDRPETLVRLRQAGMEPDGTVVVLVLRADGPPDPAGTAHALLTDALVGAGPAAVGVHDGAAVAVLAVPGDRDGGARTGPGPGAAAGTGATGAVGVSGAVGDVGADGPVTGVLAALHRLGPGLGGWRLHGGVSRPASAEVLSGAFAEAVHAAGPAANRPGPVTVLRSAEVTSHVLLLAGVPDDVRRGFADRVLGPVHEHDARSGSRLAETLGVFLDESGSWSRTAARLHLHVNTVRYRIARVGELTGRDLSRFADRVDLYLALRSG
ncbi:PucR family transcriptional regulator ligand-binding domain-containing protein [Pseudonocardia sp. NPDC046786]|uniref:PucR family transcriptional regulator n=1 Tax=Pseudonocardia sp. NPDC046786 TaxID=3155471 RepID=UPI0033CDC837